MESRHRAIKIFEQALTVVCALCQIHCSLRGFLSAPAAAKTFQGFNNVMIKRLLLSDINICFHKITVEQYNKVNTQLT